MVTSEILSKAAVSFDFDVNTLQFISNSTNEIYRFTKNNESFILRLSHKPHVYAEKIKAEVDWIYYLVQNGVRASLPIRTIDTQLTAVYEENEKSYIAAAFDLAPGRFFDKHNPLLWGSTIFRQWGETMGRMHLLSKYYKPSNLVGKRDDWCRWFIENPSLQQGPYLVLLEKLRTLENRIDSLPRDTYSYGLIHNDFHPYNFYINGDGITVFDFDDCIHGWFVLDIAIAATHAVWWGSPKEDRKSKNEFALIFLNDFLEGYVKHNHLDHNWIQQIPMFMDYRNICSYFWWLHSWDGDEHKLNDSQRSSIARAVNLIENGHPFDGCGIQL